MLMYVVHIVLASLRLHKLCRSLSPQNVFTSNLFLRLFSYLTCLGTLYTLYTSRSTPKMIFPIRDIKVSISIDIHRWDC